VGVVEAGGKDDTQHQDGTGHDDAVAQYRLVGAASPETGRRREQGAGRAEQRQHEDRRQEVLECGVVHWISRSDSDEDGEDDGTGQ
jgi:hypothetical protein